MTLAFSCITFSLARRAAHMMFLLPFAFPSSSNEGAKKRRQEARRARARPRRENKINETSKKRTVKYISGIPRDLATMKTAGNDHVGCLRDEIWRAIFPRVDRSAARRHASHIRVQIIDDLSADLTVAFVARSSSPSGPRCFCETSTIRSVSNRARDRNPHAR